MGVNGLCGLIGYNPSLQKQYILHDCTVVIDGYFQLYAKANVHCVVVLDGGYDPSNGKLRTIQKRNMDRVYQMKRLQGADAEKIKALPSHATVVYRSILAQLNVEVIQCVFEADEYIASHANKLNCPVISDDSDFFVYDLKGGLIQLSSLDRKTVQKQLKPGGPIITGAAVPDWIVSGFVAGRIPSKIITVVATGINFLYIKIEALHMRSSYEVSLPLRKCLYGFVFKGQTNMIQELDRSGHGLRFQDVEFLEGEVGLLEIPDLSAKQRLTIFNNCVLPTANCADLVDLAEGKLLLYALEYLVLNTSVNWQFALSLLVTHVVTQATAARTEDEHVSYLLGVHVYSHEVRGFSNFFRKPTPGQRLDVQLIHKTNEYTGCFDAIYWLNGLLGAFKTNFKFHLVLNGVFLHNFYKDLNGRPQPARYLADHWQPNSRLHRMFDNLWNQILQRLFSEMKRNT
ncbi:protein asteroid1-like [Tropilaelaps mercedesae]|uniref:Protein asteroid1-like n=1 Tax=Tropilaelaps mercedesae TaxID=418985 RepID=A0A1V9Y1I1_9ACAR|nr:protein asteroid1-like [Tropilaelaps mercedesae]